MFLPIERILEDIKTDFETVLNNREINELFLKKVNEYYKININEIFNNLSDLEKLIFKLTNSHPIMFHHFHNSNFPKYSQGSISDDEFENLINSIGLKNILDGDVWLEKYNNGELKKGETCITIDDGLKCQYIVILPILKKYNIKAIWFIYSHPLIGSFEMLDLYKYFVGNIYKDFELFYKDFFEICLEESEIKNECSSFSEENSYLKYSKILTIADRKFRYLRDKIISKEKFEYLIRKLATNNNFNLDNCINKIWVTSDNIIELDKNQIIGIHSHTHPTAMEDLSYNQQFEEYKKCKDILEKILNKEVNILSYPCGKYNSDTFDILEKLNIHYSFISYLSIPTNNKNYLIQREDHMNIINNLKKKH